MTPRQIAILGSTGSIGRNTLEVVRALDGQVRVVGLAANTDVARLRGQIAEMRPVAAGVSDECLARDLESDCARAGTELVGGGEALRRIATLPEADLVVNALVGAVGIEPTFEAIKAGKDVAIANKESLVAAGSLIVEAAEEAGVSLIPIDSEHSAICQCIRGEAKSAIKRIILTASGGPLLDMSPEEIAGVTAERALSHPTWKMGRKVTIDSATLLNKGFEVIEARWLFGIGGDHIEVVIERKSVVHSLVEFVDGSVCALLSAPDMRLPIQYALTYPERVRSQVASLDLEAVGTLAFEKPDRKRFPCLQLAYEALELGSTAPAVLSAADEVAVEAFLDGRLKLGEIYSVLREVLSLRRPAVAASLSELLEADRWARLKAEELVAARYGSRPS
ncbi:MAG TPA: 1-deoxy-D-xylulose-5-phosphate reductoisomerase [bacterium]|nr:1-deoxy-D-xylulose-5-phosphate reductoisomerase [bacterium]